MADSVARHAARDALTLLALPRVGLRGWHRRVAGMGSARAALNDGHDAAALSQARRAADAVLASAEQIGCELVVFGEDGYPGVLYDLTAADSGELSPAPPVLFVAGRISMLQQPAVAIVGTRHASATGLRAAERIARACGDAGAVVISGLARGVDAAAHTGAVATAGGTCAVIGTGLDIAYPADHRGLQRRIATDGLLLSEAAPGQRATRGSFPERNRLIAALASVTVVVEAGHKSGALLTARAAIALGRTVAAVPGAFDAAASQGSNELLRDGAHVVASVDDVLALLHLASPPVRTAIAPSNLTEAERAIWGVLGDQPLELDLIVERAGWAADACLAAVTTLEMKGLVRATQAGALQRA